MRFKKQIEAERARRKRVEQTLVKREEEYRKLLKQSHVLQVKLRCLSRRVFLAQEEERKRISRELHDIVARVLMGINLKLAALKMDAYSSPKVVARKISNTQRLVEKSVDVIHRFARELRPALLDDLGLIPALHSYMEQFAKETGIRAKLTASSEVEQLGNVKRTVLYRVAQEALTNVARHAHATRVDVCIERKADRVLMRVQDDGQAFNVERVCQVGRVQKLGLLGMKERIEMVAGSFKVESVAGKGTTVLVEIPFAPFTRSRS